MKDLARRLREQALVLRCQAGDDDAVESVPLFMLYNSTPWRGVYTKDWTYARSLDSKRNQLYGGAVVDVLYDHQKDPHQLNNLFDDPSSVGKRAEMDALTRRWMAKFDDRGYSMGDFHQAAGKNEWWQKNYTQRPIDLLNKTDNRF